MSAVGEQEAMRYVDATAPRGAVDVGEHYSFRFVEKYRIRHDWLSGVNIRSCHYGVSTIPAGQFVEIFGNPPERNPPFVERDGKLQEVLSDDHGGIRYSTSHEWVYGAYPGRPFKRYVPFCEQAFISSHNGFGLSIIKPDPAKGTDAYIENATPVELNGLRWLVKKIPPRDMTDSRAGLAAPIEIWTLKIPDTAYWMVLEFTADLKGSIEEHNDQHTALLALFHQIVDSVRVEPLSSIR